MNGVYYHATTREAAQSIVEDGFQGGWGDDGYGVYLFGTITGAAEYISKGGWDNSHTPDDMVIVMISAPEEDVSLVIPNPAWPNPEDYADIHVYHMEDDSEHHWKHERCIIEDTPAPVPKL